MDRPGTLLTGAGRRELAAGYGALVRAAGEPVIGTLEAQLKEPRRQRVATAIKLLSAVQPQRLAAALPRVLSGWDWSLQDLAVSELSRQPSPCDYVRRRHMFSCPFWPRHICLWCSSMLDQIALAGEHSAVPQLWAIAAGDVEQLRDIFIRIKAVEALGVCARRKPRICCAIWFASGRALRAEPEGCVRRPGALALIENQGPDGLQAPRKRAIE